MKLLQDRRKWGPSVKALDVAETGLALLLLLSGLLWLLLMLIHAGPLWRDELSSVNVAESASLRALWEKLGNDSCPLLWPLILRGWLSLGMQSDLEIRVLGLLIAMCLLGSPWLITRFAGRRVPILSMALLSFSPAFLFTVSSIRAYGVGSLLLVSTLGLAWRIAERATPARLAWLAIASTMAAHSLYTAAPFLFVILSACILILIGRRRWRSATWVLGIGCFAAASLVVYRPIVLRAGETLGLFQIPIDIPWVARSMERALGSGSPFQLLGWVMLMLLGIWLYIRSTRHRPHIPDGKGDGTPFFLWILFAAPVLYGATLLRIKVPTQFWYYAPLMAVMAVGMDGVLGSRRFPSWMRICRMILAVFLVLSAVSPLWLEVHTRRTNMDMAARELTMKAGLNDLIIVDPFYLLTSFERYYLGKNRWTTIPPVHDRRGGGYETVKHAMMQEEPLRELFSDIRETFHSGNRVWIVGGVLIPPDPQKLPPPLPPPPNGLLGWNHNPYSHDWSLRLGAFLFSRAGQVVQIPTDPGRPVNPFESVSLLMFSPRSGSGEE